MSTVEDFQDYHGYVCRDLQKICDYTCGVTEVHGELFKVKNVCENFRNVLAESGYAINSDQIGELQQNIVDAKSAWNDKVGTAEMRFVRDVDRGWSSELIPGGKNQVIYDVTSEFGTCIDWLKKMKQCLRIIKERSQ